jgi:hypothetical protein
MTISKTQSSLIYDLLQRVERLEQDYKYLESEVVDVVNYADDLRDAIDDVETIADGLEIAIDKVLSNAK